MHACGLPLRRLKKDAGGCPSNIEEINTNSARRLPRVLIMKHGALIGAHPIFPCSIHMCHIVVPCASLERRQHQCTVTQPYPGSWGDLCLMAQGLAKKALNRGGKGSKTQGTGFAPSFVTSIDIRQKVLDQMLIKLLGGPRHSRSEHAAGRGKIPTKQGW